MTLDSWIIDRALQQQLYSLLYFTLRIFPAIIHVLSNTILSEGSKLGLIQSPIRLHVTFHGNQNFWFSFDIVTTFFVC